MSMERLEQMDASEHEREQLPPTEHKPATQKRRVSVQRRIRHDMPRERPPVFSQPLHIQQRIIPLGEEIKLLCELKRANGGRLPPGELQSAASHLGVHVSSVKKTVRQFESYHHTYANRPPAEAFSPFLKPGRPPGRALSDEVIDFIKKAWIKQDWLSINHDDTSSKIKQTIGARYIRSGVEEVFPEYKGIITLSDIYHVRDDLRREQPDNLALATRGKTEIEANLPTMNSTVDGVNEQWQSDIRPLPTFVRYGELICTVRLLYIMDHKSRFILARKLIPGKSVDKEGYVVSGDFTCQEFRQIWANAIIKHKRRPRMFYPDNGSQYKAQTLGPYMPYLVSPGDEDGETATILINRRPRRPRGGGGIESELGDIDEYLRYRPGYFDEQNPEGEFGYRAIYAKIKAGIIKPRLFDELAKDIDYHVEILNTDSSNGHSRLHKWQTGKEKGLPPPSFMNLLVFAKSVKRKPVKVQRYGIDYGKDTEWEPVNDTEEVRAQWLRAAMKDSGKRELLIIELAGEEHLYLNLAGDGVTWEPLVKKGAPRRSIKEHNQLNEAVLNALRADNAQASAEIDAFLEGRGQPLVIDASRKRLVKPPSPAPKRPTQRDEGDLPEPDFSASAEQSSPSQSAQPPQFKARKPRSRQNAKPSGDAVPGTVPPAAPPNPAPDDDDWSDFAGFRSHR